MTTIVGIDPGLDGGIAILNDEREPELHAMPTVKTGKGNAREVDVMALRGLLLRASPGLVVIEEQKFTPNIPIKKAPGFPATRFASGGKGNFTKGQVYGTLCTVVAMLLLPYQVVMPKRWQKLFGFTSGNTKEQSIATCLRLFPGINLKRTAKCKNLHDGMADALLIAEYGRRLTLPFFRRDRSEA